MKLNNLCKKAQEDMIGFIMIVALFSIALLAIFVLFPSSENEKNIQSGKVYQFLEASMRYNSGCSVGKFRHISIEELFVECSENNKVNCWERGLNDVIACMALEMLLKDILSSSWSVSSDSYLKGYTLDSLYYEKNASEIELVKVIAGNCTTSKKEGNEFLISKSPGIIRVRLILCY